MMYTFSIGYKAALILRALVVSWTVCLWNFRAESRITPRYFTDDCHFMSWPFILMRLRLVDYLSSNKISMVLLGLIIDTLQSSKRFPIRMLPTCTFIFIAYWFLLVGRQCLIITVKKSIFCHFVPV